jgi:DNA modification methylase
VAKTANPSAVVDTRVIYCGDNLDQLRKLPDDCVDLIYIDPPFNSNRNYEVFRGGHPRHWRLRRPFSFDGI